jgi:hypothetical protein
MIILAYALSRGLCELSTIKIVNILLARESMFLTRVIILFTSIYHIHFMLVDIVCFK